MASTVEATYRGQITGVTTFTGEGVSGSDPTVTLDGHNFNGVLNASSTPPATKQTTFEQALTAGAATLDLTALPGLSADETVDLTGLKVQLVILTNPDTNANNITIAQGASNAYGLLGATFSITLAPGQSTGPIYLDDASPDVAAGAKEIDLAGTAAQVLNVHIVAG